METEEPTSRATTLSDRPAGVNKDNTQTKPSSPNAIQSRADPEKQEPIPAADIVDASPKTRAMPTYKWILVLASLYAYSFLYGLDTTIAADIQGAVVSTFGNVSQLAWLGAGFPLGSVAIILMVGALYNSFNYKYIFVASVLLFEVGSAICGAAPSMDALIVGRVVAGTGGSGMYLGALNYISSLTSPAERGGYISGIGMCWGLGCVLGPVVGGGFAESAASWRWAFYINLPVGALVAPLTLFYAPPLNRRQGVSVGDRFRELDVLGFVLNIGVWVTFALAFTMAGGQWPWADGRAIATIVVFGVLLTFYAIQQYLALFTTPATRSFPIHLLRSRTQVLLYVALSANITTTFVVVYFIPIYFQFVHDDTALMAAVRLLPFVIVMVVVNLATGSLLSRIRRYMAIFLASGVLILAGGLPLMVFLNRGASEANIYGFTILMAVGAGLTMQLSYSVGPLAAEEKDQGHVISFMNVAQIGGTVIALVVAGQVFQSLAVRNLQVVLAGKGFSDVQIRSGVAGVRSELFLQLSGGQREAAIDAITRAMQKAFVLPVVAGAVMIVASVLMKREKQFRKVVTAG